MYIISGGYVMLNQVENKSQDKNAQNFNFIVYVLHRTLETVEDLKGSNAYFQETLHMQEW